MSKITNDGLTVYFTENLKQINVAIDLVLSATEHFPLLRRKSVTVCRLI